MPLPYPSPHHRFLQPLRPEMAQDTDYYDLGGHGASHVNPELDEACFDLASATDSLDEDYYDLGEEMQHDPASSYSASTPLVLPGVVHGSSAWCSAMANRRWNAGESSPWKQGYERLADAYDTFPLRHGDCAQRPDGK